MEEEFNGFLSFGTQVWHRECSLAFLKERKNTGSLFGGDFDSLRYIKQVLGIGLVFVICYYWLHAGEDMETGDIGCGNRFGNG